MRVWISRTGNFAHIARASGVFLMASGVFLMAALGLLSGCDSGGVTANSTISSNARLRDLQLSTGQLNPPFQSGQSDHTAMVGYLSSFLRVTAYAEDANSTLTINGVTTASGTASGNIGLAEGNNNVVIEVTAPDGSTLRYQVDVARESVQGFAQRANVKASNTEAGDSFGFGVALSGDTLAVSAYLEDSPGTGVDGGGEALNGADSSGAVYVFTRIAGVWSQQAYIKASNTERGDRFGFSIALSGDTLAVGAYLEDSSGSGVNSGAGSDDSAPDSGAVYVFTRTAGVWRRQAYIKASNTGSGDRFGRPVALSGDTLAVGAHREDSNGTSVNSNTEGDNSAPDSGAVYVFARTGGDWSQQAYIKASNAESGDWFGFSVALSGDTLAAGAYREDSSGSGVNSVTEADNSESISGAVYVFARSGSQWSQQAYVKAHNTDTDDWFGVSVALSADTLAVGAHREDSSGSGVNSNTGLDESAPESGAVYVFTRTADVWSQQAYIKASNTDGDDRFGRSLALWGDTLAVGAHLEDSNGTGVNGNAEFDNSSPDSGAAYVFTRQGGVWSQQAYLKASNTGSDDRFGRSMALSGDTLAVGAQQEDSSGSGVNGGTGDDDSAPDSGAVFIYR